MVKFNFGFYPFFCSGIMPLFTLAGSGASGHILPFFSIYLLSIGKLSAYYVRKYLLILTTH
jgi:hypothetical protein